jgi:hypothetical protein
MQALAHVCLACVFNAETQSNSFTIDRELRYVSCEQSPMNIITSVRDKRVKLAISNFLASQMYCRGCLLDLVLQVSRAPVYREAQLCVCQGSSDSV